MNLLYANDTLGQHAKSWYAATVDIPEYPTLKSIEQFDVCVVGGGYTGLSAALTAASSGLSVCVLEAHRVGWGASGRNGGQLGSGFNRHESLLAKFGADASQQYWQLADRAKAYVLSISEEYNFSIDYQPGIVNALHQPVSPIKLRQAVAEFNAQHDGAQLQSLDRDELQAHIRSKDYYAGVYDPNAGHLHPLKLAVGLAAAAQQEGALIYERSAVTTLDYPTINSDTYCLHTENGRIQAKYVVCAMNGYLDGLIRKARRDVIPINNFIVSTEPLGQRIEELLPSNAAIADSRFVVNYFRRSHDNRLLFGGGENYGYRFPTDLTQRVQQALLGVFPSLHDVHIDYAWGGTLGITRTRWPSVQELQPRLYSSSGYSGHGVALANFCGQAVGKAIAGDSEDFAQLNRLPTGVIPGSDAVRPWLASMAMYSSALLDKLPNFRGSHD